MKPTLLFLVVFFALTLAEYPRLKYRGPSPYPKPPPFHQISKKWQQRPPLRSPRPQPPIPVHMPTHHKIPIGMAASINRPVALPVRAFWKNTQTTYKPPPLNMYVTSAPIPSKTVFQSSPPIQEYDFRQTNNIPTPIKTIKQIGEKGPIHTIPAPNLSPADRPLVIQELKPAHQPELAAYHQPEIATYVQVQKSHQYQVTEVPDAPKPLGYQPNELYHLLNTYTLQEPQDYLQLVPQHVDPQEHVAMDKSFEESAKKELVTASYNLEPEVSESIVHSQYVQNYFGSGANHVEPDAKPSNGKNNTEGFYVSLPNKEAAETLANLQAAGKLNSNLMQMANGGELPVSIYVPDDDDKSRERDGQSGEEAEPNYDDYEDDLMTEEMQQGREEAFGHRLRPK